jgi:alkylation response protein AidB-like acyl-CoA dehydrogenase
MTDRAVTDAVAEDIDAFRLRARAWLADNMLKLPTDNPFLDMPVDDDGIRGRELQRKVFDGGFAGLVYPKEYGGQGLTRAHQLAFNEESAGYEMPLTFNVPSLTIIAPTLLDFGTEEQKKRHLPAILRGEELWVQFLSEPSGGSDLAGLLTRATRDGDVWILNGSKIWSSGAYRSDYALCLARTDWGVQKHRGLTMFIVKIHQPGITVQQIKMVTGSHEFCQEYFDDVAIPAENVLGEVNDGWTVASRLLFHERDAVGGGSPYFSGFNRRRGPQRDLVELAVEVGQTADPRVRQLVAEAHVNDVVQQQLIERVTTGLRTRHFPGPAGSLLRLYAGMNGVRRTDIGFEIAATGATAWPEDKSVLGQYGQQFVMRQASCLGGGSTEMQRNIISERLLGMPREYAADREKPFSEVRQNRLPLSGS